MNKFYTGLVAVIAALFLSTAFSAPTPASEPDNPATAKIRATLHERYPDVKVKQISQSPVMGLYELITDAGIAYVDATGDHLILGKILDTKTKEDLTEDRWNALNTIPFDQLPLQLAIKFVKGDGKRRLAVFEDPHCPFCRQLEGELQKVTNTTLYVFLYPIESLHPGATETSRNIWCAKDRAAEWKNAMVNNQKPPAANCKADALQTLASLGDKLNINATPTIFFPNGKRHAGAMPSDRLEKELSENQ